MYDPRKLQAIKNIQNIKEFNGSMRQAIKAAGYSDQAANNPKTITDSKWFKTVLPTYQELATVIKDEVKAAKLDHYVFPLSMKDEEIIELIESVPGCKVRKIKHGETQTWAYFWLPDHKSRQTIMDTIFKLQGDYAPIKTQIIDPYESMTNEQLKEEEERLEREIEGRGINNG